LGRIEGGPSQTIGRGRRTRFVAMDVDLHGSQTKVTTQRNETSDILGRD